MDVMTRTFLNWMALAGCGLAVGCARPADPGTPTMGRVAAQTPEAYSGLYEAAAETLRRSYFRLDRQDRFGGVITTHPETTANWFELWRPQPEPGYYWWEANTGTIQRQASVRLLASTTQPGDYEVEVEVQRLRYSLPERQIDNSAAALRLYSEAAPTAEGRMERPSQTAHWIPLGRDAFAEQRLLTDIVNRYAAAPTMPVTTQPADVAAAQ
jgi:hypothetical protein